MTNAVYLLVYIDRINVSFAGLTMRDDLNTSAAAFGLTLGTFYWGYSVFELRSNLIMERVGARLWTARFKQRRYHRLKGPKMTDRMSLRPILPRWQ
jgi:sugar phosphate permease